MKLGLSLGYTGNDDPADQAAQVALAEELGFDSLWSAEAYGSDAFTPLAWHGSMTSRLRLGTAIVQMSARTPTATAMAAMTLDRYSGGRAVIGLGVSGPQVVEGWYGQPFRRPLARTREYIDVLRQVMAREKVAHDGAQLQIPYAGDGSTGLGKSLRSTMRPLRDEIPLLLAAEGPKNIALAAEIADGWLPLFYTPRLADTYNAWLDEGFNRPGARRSREDFEICATAQIVITDDVEATYAAIKPFLALYMGGMGSEDTNFHAEVYRRAGYGELVDEVTRLFRSDRKEEAAAIIPDEVVRDAAIVGDAAFVKEQIGEWEKAGVTSMLVSPRNVAELERLAELIA